MFVQDYSVQLARGSANEIAGWVQLNGHAATRTKSRFEIPEAGIEFKTLTTRTAMPILVLMPACWPAGNSQLRNAANR